jgi:hypothetical protein
MCLDFICEILVVSDIFEKINTVLAKKVYQEGICLAASWAKAHWWRKINRLATYLSFLD